MSRSIDALDDDTYARLLQPIWAYLTRTDRPAPSDVIFVFGSRDLGVPRRAAELYLAGLSSRVLVSGRLGPMTARVFDKPEALVFKDALTSHGVPDSAITTEVDACNTLENVRLGMSALRAAGQTPHSALLVAKAFVMRRCLATFARQYPGVAVRGCPPSGSLAAQRDRPARRSPPGSWASCADSTTTARRVTSRRRRFPGGSAPRHGRWPALLHEYPLRVGRRGPHFSGPSAGATLRG